MTEFTLDEAEKSKLAISLVEDIFFDVIYDSEISNEDKFEAACKRLSAAGADISTDPHTLFAWMREAHLKDVREQYPNELFDKIFTMKGK